MWLKSHPIALSIGLDHHLRDQYMVEDLRSKMVCHQTFHNIPREGHPTSSCLITRLEARSKHEMNYQQTVSNTMCSRPFLELQLCKKTRTIFEAILLRNFHKEFSGFCNSPLEPSSEHLLMVHSSNPKRQHLELIGILASYGRFETIHSQ